MTFGNFSALTLDNLAVKNLGEVLFQTAFAESNLFDTCRPQTGVLDGQKIDWVDKINDVGVKGRQCDPNYSSVVVTGAEQQWELGDWNIAKKLCYTDLVNTIAKWCLNTGTKMEDLTNTDYWNKIMLPLLDKALHDFYWRTAWFADPTANNVDATSGNTGRTLTSGVDNNLMIITKGLFYRIATRLASNSAQRTTIAANSATTKSAQKANLRGTSSDATPTITVLDELLADADSRIKQNGGILMMTSSFYQSLRRQYAQTYHETIPFMEVADGFELPHYDGVAIREVPEWDTLIAKYFDNGTILDKPHRVLFANPDNFLVGTSAKTTFADFDVTFDPIKRYNYMYAASNVGTMIHEDDLFQIAW